MSEPRNKKIDQTRVRRFYEEVCAAVAGVDERVPCVVGPAPYYKPWRLDDTLLLRHPNGSKRENVIYTFDLFEPWEYITSREEEFTYTAPSPPLPHPNPTPTPTPIPPPPPSLPPK